ncbi:MAG: hypothetical protein H6719_13860 [Sandaracinaceae bacterium]|nr:hypothetical protein [Sandaracinaceae bacterium]
MIYRCIALGIALAGCGIADDTDPCERRMAALETRLAEAARTAPPSEAPTEVQLAPSEHGVLLEGAPPLLVVGDEVVFQGRGVGGGDDVDRVAETLRSDLRSWEAAQGLEGPEVVTIALWADASSSADTLARLLRHAPPNVRFAGLVRGPPLGPLEHEPEWLDQTLSGGAQGRPEGQRVRFETAWTRATSDCPAARGQMPAPAAVRQGGPPLGAPSIDGLMTALRSCSCDHTDFVAVEAVARRALVDPAGSVHRLRATLRFGAPTDAAPVIEVETNQTVADLVARIDEREGMLWVRSD